MGKSFTLKHLTKRSVGSPDLCTQSGGKNELRELNKTGIAGTSLLLIPCFHYGSITAGSKVQSQLKACQQLSGWQMSINKIKGLLVLQQGVSFNIS